MISQKTVLVLLAVLLCSSYTQECASSDLFQTGLVEISNPSSGREVTYSAQVPIKYQIPSIGFECAAFLADFNYDTSKGIDFLLRCGRIGTSNNMGVSLSLAQDTRWTKIQISYIVQSRNDTWVGSFTSNVWGLNQIDKGQELTTTKVTGCIQNWPASNAGKNFHQALFISGIKSDLSVTNIKVSSIDLNEDEGSFSLQIVNASRGIQQVTFSYTIFSNPHSTFTLGTYNYPASSPVATADYSFVGLSRFISSGSTPSFYGVSVISNSSHLQCKGTCPSSCTTRSSCTSQNGNVTNGACFICPSPSFFNSTSQSCQINCGANEEVINGACQCQNGFVKLATTCVNRCGLNQEWTGTECVCIANTARLNNVCRSCPSGSKPNAAQTDCQCDSSSQVFNLTMFRCSIPTCGEGQYYNTTLKICQCYSPRTLSSSGQCICPNNLAFNSTSGQCICSKQFEEFTQNTCSCKDPYIRQNNGECALVCKQNEWWFGGECICKQPYVNVQGKCTIVCGDNEVWDSIKCACKAGFDRINGQCSKCPPGTAYSPGLGACKSVCGTNEVPSRNTCICAAGFERIDGKCSKCPPGTAYSPGIGACKAVCRTNEVLSGNICICAEGLVRQNGVCAACPSGTTYSATDKSCRTITCGAYEQLVNGQCVCLSGYNRVNGYCIRCPTGTTYNSTTQKCDTNVVVVNCGYNQVNSDSGCVCISGYYLVSGVCTQCPTGTSYDSSLKRCIRQPICPARSSWDDKKFICVCQVRGENLINGECKTCSENQGWNGSQCVCRSGYFMMRDGTCVTCDINTSYNATRKECSCNRGFYGDRTQCQKCHATCGTCSGPNADQCIECYDLSYSFSSGKCSRGSNCAQGKYQDGPECKACSQYCTSCTSADACTTCATGFNLSKTQILTYEIAICDQICGDGRRFETQCDDGNTQDGDGCSSTCTQQAGYTCTGGTTTSRSYCAAFNPTRTFINPNGAVQFGGKVLQGVTLSYLPDALTAGGCKKCSEVLMVTVIQGQIFPSYRVNYRLTTQYKFIIEFDFRGIFGIPPFTFTLRINPDYAEYFSEEDIAQQVTVTVDTAVLALGEEVEALTLDEILGNTIAVSDTDLNRIFDN